MSVNISYLAEFAFTGFLFYLFQYEVNLGNHAKVQKSFFSYFIDLLLNIFAVNFVPRYLYANKISQLPETIFFNLTNLKLL